MPTRQRVNSACSSASNGGGLANEEADYSSPLPSPNSRHLRVNMTKINCRSIQATITTNDINKEEGKGETENQQQTKRKRKHSEGADSNTSKKKQKVESPIEDSPQRKRRTELDKLFDACSSSFHFETAKAASERLGPIHIDVDDDDTKDDDNDDNTEEEESQSDAEKRRPPGWLTIPSKKKKTPTKKAIQKKQRLLKKVSPNDCNKKSAAQAKITQFFPKTNGQKVLSPKSIPPPPKKNRGKFQLSKDPDTEADTEDDNSDHTEYESPLLSYVPDALVKELELELSQVDGSEVMSDSLRFSFEHTPAREGWFQTYTRQDQGDEILYYPEPKSFPLPYEMPLSTFYPRKEKGDAAWKGKDSKGSSKNTSVNPSGAVTPVQTSNCNEHELSGRGNSCTRGGSSMATALAASNRLKEALTSRKTRGSKILSSTSNDQKTDLSIHERKSPRGHASTKSLISASFGGGLNGDNTVEITGNEDRSSFAGGEDIMGEEPCNDYEKQDFSTSFGEHLDECSNDSWAPSEYGNSKQLGGKRNYIPVQEGVQQYREMARTEQRK